MNNNLKDLVQDMIDKGYSENEISIQIKNHQSQQKPIIKKEKTSLKNKIIKKAVSSKSLPYILELVFPIILTSLFYYLVKTKRMSVDRDAIAGLVSFLFFFILVLEWIRRKKDKTERAYYFKYLYIGLMLFVFVLGVWYANELVVDYQAPKRTKFSF